MNDHFYYSNPSQTPAIVTSSGTQRLPRRVLMLLCMAYVLAGFIGRDPWKNTDITALGYMQTLAQGQTSWWTPQLLQHPSMEMSTQLLPYWLGAWAIQLAPAWLPPQLAVRLPFILLLAITLFATWRATYYLARSPAALPVVFAFGGEAKPNDYARSIADGSALALIACLGLAQLSHETSPALFQLAFASLFFYGASSIFYRPLSGAILIFVSAIALVFSGAFVLIAILLLAYTSIFLTQLRCEGNAAEVSNTHSASNFSLVKEKILNKLILLLFLITFLASTVCYFWLQELFNNTNLPHAALTRVRFSSYIRLILWFSWPALPLVIWALWRWRKQLQERHIAYPLCYLLTTCILASYASDQALLIGLPAWATLAAFALPTLKRRVAALIDWFTLFFFSLAGVVIWLVWLAMQTGMPQNAAEWIRLAVPGFIPSFSWLPLFLALLASATWAYLVKWRVKRYRTAIWKSLVLPATGTALCWILLMTLWLPAINYARSYKPLVEQVLQVIPQTQCVEIYELSQAQISALKVHGQYSLTPARTRAICPWLIMDADAQDLYDDSLPIHQWHLHRKIRRPSDDNEDIVIFKKIVNKD